VPISGLYLSKISKSVSRHDNYSHMVPPASALRPNSSVLVSLFVGSGLCFLRLAGNDSAGGSSSPIVESSFLRRIQSFHTSTERLKKIKVSRCLLSADGSLSPCESTSSKYCFQKKSEAVAVSVTVLALPEIKPELFARHSTLHIFSLPVVLPLMLSLYNSCEF